MMMYHHALIVVMIIVIIIINQVLVGRSNEKNSGDTLANMGARLAQEVHQFCKGKLTHS